jgi:DNA ligase-1
MADLRDGETIEVQGSGRTPYVLRNVGGVYSCTCPAWRNQSLPIERRTCKHLRKLRGEAAERQRLGDALPQKPKPTNDDESGSSAPSLLLAQPWDNAADLTDWWLSEKLDGVRAFWDGHQFTSRRGNLFHVPDWFTAGLPTMPLDGELWLGRKMFQRCVSIVRRQDKSELWRTVRFLVFDLPQVKAPFEERMAEIKEHLASGRPEFAEALEQLRCRGTAHLREELARIEAQGGEGLMLRQPGSFYEAGRSNTLLKVKSFHDAEARVVGHLPGAGRHKGRLGALVVQLEDGTEFSVGTGFSDAQREAPPPCGSLVTFRYQELTDRGMPRFPSFVRVASKAAQWEGASARSGRAAPKSSTKKSPPRRESIEKAASQGSNATKRRFEFVEGSSAKFWEIEIDGGDVTVRYGRIGTQGQSQTKSFADSESANAQADKLIGEKTKKGYVER